MTQKIFELVNAQKPELCRSIMRLFVSLPAGRQGRIAQKDSVITYSLICPRT